MGDMGQRNKPSREKRAGNNKRRSRKEPELLDWFPDGYRRETPHSKKLIGRWLAASFAVSNPKPFQRVSGNVIQDMVISMTQVAASVSKGGHCEISISEPERGHPYWSSDLLMTVDGVRHETSLEALDVNDLMSSTLGWINQAGVK